jgi:death on curing protein
LDSIQYPLFGSDRYPTIIDKSSLLTWTIIAKHIFYDANKRTGISSLQIFGIANGFEVRESDDGYVEVAKMIATGSRSFTQQDLTEWIRQRIVPLYPIYI